MISKLRRKRVPPWDINSAPPRKRWINSLAQWVNSLFCLIFLSTGPVWAEPFAYIPHYYDHKVSVIDIATNTVTDTVTVGTFPEGIAIAPDGSRVYITNIGDESISVIDTSTNQVTNTFSLSSIAQRIAISPDGSKLYLEMLGNLIVLSSQNGQKIGKLSDIDFKDVSINLEDITISPDGSKIYAVGSNGNTNSANVIVVIDANNYSILKFIPINEAPHLKITISPDGSRVYAIHGGFSNLKNPDNFGGIVSIVNTDTQQVVTTLSLSDYVGYAGQATVSPDGKYLYVIVGDEIVVIDTSNNNVLKTLAIEERDPSSISLTSDGVYAYVIDSYVVEVINTNSNTKVASISVDEMDIVRGHFIADNLNTTIPNPNPNPDNTIPTSYLDGKWRIYNDRTVVDTDTDLMWQQDDDLVRRNWVDAKAFCDNSTLGGHHDWKLPTRTELENIRDFDGYRLLPTVFEGGSKVAYWSGTTNDKDEAWRVDFNTGQFSSFCGKTVCSLYVRCVRNPSGNQVVDTTRPTITITSPTRDSSLNTDKTSLSVTVQASDNVGVEYISWASSHGENGMILNNESQLFPLIDKTTTITVKAFDAAGNSQSDTLTINKVSAFLSHPQIEVIDAPSTAKVGQSYTIRLRATDPNNNLKKIQVDWYANGNWTTEYVSDGQKVSFSKNYPRSGNFTWMAKAIDSSGKESYPIVRSVTVKPNPSTAQYTGYRASSTLRSSQKAQCRKNCLVADPIDTATGAQVLTHELLSVNGVLPISATVSYNSLLLTKGLVGRSWNLNGFDIRLQALPSGDIEVHWSANRSNVFKKQGNGQFSSTDLVTLYDKLVTNEDDSFTLTRQNQTIYQFDTNGWLVALSNQQGQTLEFKHDDAGRLIQVTEPVSGVFLKYAYNNNGLLATVSDSKNRQVRLGYDSEHNLVTITDAAAKTMTYTYNEFGQTLTGTNGDNVRLFTNTYDSEGRIIAQDDSVEGNQQFRLHYDETSQPDKIITTVTNRNGHTRVFTYDDNYQLLSLQNERGKITSYVYINGRRISETDAKGHSQIFDYDSQGHLVAITNAANFTTYLSYGSYNNLFAVTNPLNQTVRWAYDANNRVIRHTDRAKQITHLAYNEHGQVSKVTTPKDATTTYTYQQGLLTAITNAEGHTQTFAYDKAGRIIRITDADQKTTVLTYDPLDRLRTITDPLKRTVAMTYDSRDNLVTFTKANGKMIRRIYDGNGNLREVIDPLNRSTHYEYDGEDQLIKFRDAEGNTTTMQRDAVGHIVKRIMPSASGSAETQVVYDAVGNVTQTIDALGQIVEMAYDALNNPIKSIDASGFATTMTYDKLGRLVAMTNALGFSVSQTYDVRGNVFTVQDAMGNTTGYVYDEQGNLTSETNALNQTTRYQYDSLDRLIKIIDAKGNKTRLVYDAKGRMVRVIDPLKRKQQLAYDEVDNLVKVTDTLNNTVQTHYDALNNPSQVTDALGRSTTFGYDAENRLTQLQDALNRITTLEYDNVDRLMASVDALKGRSSQAFDAEGNRTELVDPNGHQTQFEFDNKGRLVAEISSAGGRQAYGYNARDLLTEITNAREQTRHIEYDALGRITQITDADGIISYAYDRNGNVLTVSDENSTIKREYDALNRVTKYTDIQSNIIQYAYDEVGNLITLTYPDNRQVHYDYDAANQLIQVTDWAKRETHYEWETNGRLIKETRPNGTVMTRRYDNAGQLVQQQDVLSSGEVIAQFEFSYDTVGNITNETPALKPPMVDATLTYTAANQLETYNGKTVKFDADGNMIKGPLNGAMQPFQFDSRNRLNQIADTVYVYNAENQRMAVKSQGKVTQYVINPQAALSQVLVKTAPDGTPTYYVYGLGLIGEETNGTYQAYHYDLRGSTVALTDASGTVVDRFQYSAFAQLVNHEGSSDTPFLYNGRDGVMTDANGLYYMRARYYNLEIRRFVNQDVLLGDVGNGQTLNRYAFVTGNPVSYVDPLGLLGFVPWVIGGLATYYSLESYNASQRITNPPQRQYRERMALEEEIQELDRQIAEKESLYYLKQASQDLGMVPISEENIQYIMVIPVQQKAINGDFSHSYGCWGNSAVPSYQLTY